MTHLLFGEIEVEGRMPYSSNATFSRPRHSTTASRTRPSTSQCGASGPSGISSPDCTVARWRTYRMSEALGLHVVPPTVLRDGPVGEGSVQWFVAGDFTEHYFTMMESRVDLHDRFRALALLDIICNNTDRKSGHCFLSLSEALRRDAAASRVWGIDHGLCFAAEYKLRTVIWEFGDEPISDHCLIGSNRLVDRVPLDIATLLSDDEVEAIQGRAAWCCQAPPLSRPTRPAAAIPGHWSELSVSTQLSRELVPCEDAYMTDDDLDDLIHAADLDGLVRMIDDRCSTGDWDGLLRVRDQARSAVKTGRQLWPAATLAEYRLALLAPPHHVAAVLDESDGLSGQFTIGPLTEVAAQHHTWDALRSELTPSPRAAFVAHERADSRRSHRR